MVAKKKPVVKVVKKNIDYKPKMQELQKQVNLLQEKILDGSPTGHFSEIVNRMDEIING